MVAFATLRLVLILDSETAMEPFLVKDCSLITCMGGVDLAMNLRELRERLGICPIECLQHHFCEPVLRATFDDPEFRNDFAVWAARDLRDRHLAERLGAVNPYQFEDFHSLRGQVLEIVDDHLNELPIIPWAPRGSEFRFMRSVTIVFDTDMTFRTVGDLARGISDMTTSSIFFHFVAANLRPPRNADDFSVWLSEFGEPAEPMVKTLRSLDFYYLTLNELKAEITAALNQ